MFQRIAGVVVLFALSLAQPVAATEVFSVERASGEVLVFDERASGDAAPLRRLSTNLSLPSGIVIDTARREIFLADIASVEVFPLDGSGEVQRLRRLNVPNPRALAVDPRNDELYVLSGDRRIEVYPRTATGTTTPKRVIDGAATGLVTAVAMFVDTVHDEIFVSDWGGGKIAVFDRTASGNVAPKRILGGAATRIDTPRGVFIDLGRDELNIAQRTKVLTFARGASGNVPPQRVLDGRPGASYRSLVVSAAGELWAQDYNHGSIDVFPLGAQGTVFPVRRITGPSTGLEPFAGGMALQRALGGAAGLAGPPSCVAGPGTLCLAGGRFRAQVAWETPAPLSGPGLAVPLTGPAGYFWFFAPANVELLLKVLDACGVDGFHNFWVFAAGLTDVRVELEVLDTASGASRFYVNPQGNPFASIQDTAAFQTCAVSSSLVAAGGEPAGIAPAAAGPLGLHADRFQVSVSWATAEGSGSGTPVKLTEEAGYFWFFEPANVEVLVKVLNACAVEGFHNFWVFAAGLTDVEVEVVVLDTATGATFEISSPLDSPFPTVLATDAFDTCP